MPVLNSIQIEIVMGVCFAIRDALYEETDIVARLALKRIGYTHASTLPVLNEAKRNLLEIFHTQH